MVHIFISYAKLDTRSLAEELFTLINEMDSFSAWMDASLEPASSWANQIQREILKADLVLVLLSPDVNREEADDRRRSFVLNEIDFAQQLHKRILPVMAQPTFVPVQIAGLEYVDLSKNKEQGLKRLFATIERNYGKKETVPVTPASKVVPEPQARPSSEAKPIAKPTTPPFSLPLAAGFVGILALLVIGGFFIWPYLNGTQGREGTQAVNEPTRTEEIIHPTDAPTGTDTPTEEPTNIPTDDATSSDSPIGFWNECETPINLPSIMNIGAIFTLTGAASIYGISQQQAVELAVNGINGSGYLGAGNALSVNFEDASDPATAVSAMNDLLAENVLAVLGPTLSGHALAADPLAQENGTVVLGVSNTANGIIEIGNFVFRDSLPESAVIPGLIASAVETFDLQRVAGLYGDDTDLTINGYNAFIEALEANNVTILDAETFASGDVDFSEQLNSLLSVEPAAIVVSALAPEAIQIIIQARELGYTGHIIGGNGFNSPAVITAAGEAAEGLIVATAWRLDSPNPISQAFVEAYRDAYGSDPDQFAAQAYTGAWLIATAIRCADSTDRSAIRDSLAAIQNFDSPLGLFSFDANRDAAHAPIVQIVQNGEFVILGQD